MGDRHRLRPAPSTSGDAVPLRGLIAQTPAAGLVSAQNLTRRLFSHGCQADDGAPASSRRCKAGKGLDNRGVIFITSGARKITVTASLHAVLSRRERQIVDLLYQLGRATAADLVKALPGEPTDSTVRTQLRVLEGKGHVRHEEEGGKYVYCPVVPRRVVRKSALKHVMNTFFEGSAEKVVAALLGPDGGRLGDDELDRIAEIVSKARSEESK